MTVSMEAVNMTWSYSQSGRLVTFQGGVVRQKLSVTIAESPPSGKREMEEYQKRRMRNELHPTVIMTFAVEKNEAIRCTEISVKGGDGYATLGLEALARIGDPIEVGLKGIQTWLSVPGGSELILVRPGEGPSKALLSRGKVIDVSEARRKARTRDRDSELIQVARVSLSNPENPNKAVQMTFGYEEGTARNRRKEAIRRGFIPQGELTAEKRELAVAALDGLESKTDEEIKEVLRKIKEGSING